MSATKTERGTSARAVIGWIIAVVVAELLLIAGVVTLVRGLHRLSFPVGDGMVTNMDPFERMGRNLCGDRMDALATFGLRHGAGVLVAGGVIAVVAALTVFVAAAVGWSRLAGVLLVVALVVTIGAGLLVHHADRSFWNGPSPSRGLWSAACDGSAT